MPLNEIKQKPAKFQRVVQCREEGGYVAVDRYDHLGRQAFIRHYLGRNRPVIVGDALDEWAGLKKWNIDFFRSELGQEEVGLQGNKFEEIRRTTFAKFLDEIPKYETLPPDSPRFLEEVPYARGWSQTQKLMLLRLVESDWHRPYFMPDSLYLLPFDLLSSKPNRNKYPAFGIYISPRGAVTGFHVDSSSQSSAILCQISGSKCGFLFAPEKARPWNYNQIRHGRAITKRRVDVLNGKFPDYPGLVPYYFELHPGEVLFIPMGWAHEVFTISSSISLTYNFIHLSSISLEWLANPSTHRYFRRRLGKPTVDGASTPERARSISSVN